MKNNQLLFLEQQYFRQWWLIVLLASLFVPNIYLIVVSKTSDWFNYLFLGGLGLFTFWFFSLNLKTTITNSQINVTFDFLFFKHQKTFYVQDIKDILVLQYNPLLDCGGWGIKFWKNGRAYNIAGNKGFEIILNNGEKYLIGTQLLDQVKKIITQLNIYQND